MTKTNKATKKRFKLTKRGKLLARPRKQGHFNAKETGRKGQEKKGLMKYSLTKKILNRFLKK